MWPIVVLLVPQGGGEGQIKDRSDVKGRPELATAALLRAAFLSSSSPRIFPQTFADYELQDQGKECNRAGLRKSVLQKRGKFRMTQSPQLFPCKRAFADQGRRRRVLRCVTTMPVELILSLSSRSAFFLIPSRYHRGVMRASSGRGPCRPLL
jgi:hypothetical protein